MSTLLYGSETWTVYRRNVKKPHAFMMGHLRSIKWKDKVTNIKVLKQEGLTSMENILIRKNLRWTDYHVRIPTNRLPRQVLYFQLPEGQRPRGRPRLQDTIKEHLKKRNIDINSWKSLALQRVVWRDTIK